MSSRYSHGGGDYRGNDGYRGNGDYRGGYNSGHRNGGYPYGKINEDDVPESQHSIFVRGLPSSITYDEIKSFFEDNVGPCSFDFQKVNYERQSLFVAVRFETKEHAKEAYNKYRDEDILGCRCDVTWFRDIRRYISYQQQTGGVIRRGFGSRGGVGRFHNNHHRPEYRKRRYSDDRERRSRSRSYSDSDRSRSRSRRSSKSRSSRDRSATWNSEDDKPRRKRSRSRSEGERSSSRESDKRRSESKDEKRKDKKKEKKVKKTKKDRRSRRSESASSRSDGERSRSSSRSDRDISPSKKRTKHDGRARDGSPASSTGSPLRMTPPPPAPTIIGPIIPSSTPTPAPAPPVEKSAPLSETERSDDEDFSTRAKNGKRQRKKKSKNEEKSRWENDLEIVDSEHKEKEHTKIMITIANKSTVPVENTSFKMALDTDEPPRKIVRGPLTPEKKDDDDLMEVEEKEDEEEVPLRKETTSTDPKEKGGWRTVGGDNSGPPSDVVPESHQPPPAPALIQPTLAKVNGSPEKAVNGVEMIPRSVSGPPPPSMGTPNPPPPKRPPMGTPSSLPPPPGRPSLGGGGGVGGALATRCPEMAKTIREIKAIQDQLISTVKPNAFRLSSDLSNGESVMEKMEEREKQIGELEPMQKTKFDIKMKQIANSYRGDAQTITTVIKSVVQKDPSLEDQIKPALLAVLEDLEKQIYKKVDDFLVCGL